jgi:hypothetical protein
MRPDLLVSRHLPRLHDHGQPGLLDGDYVDDSSLDQLAGIASVCAEAAPTSSRPPT